SWYLMPEVFDHFFRLMGTTTAEQLNLVRLDPAYRVYSEPPAGTASDPIDIRSGRELSTQLF
ncbi:MAG TPA: phytoene desaturase, partial [Microbacterium sp.]|nr:phytoene desaturase [Microbacterium sp.]